MNDRASAETVIPFPNSVDLDPLDKAGQAVVSLLQQAASSAEANSQHAVGVAHKLSLQLRGAEDRIKELEANIWHYKERADRAEKWLSQISLEIEQRFFASSEGRAHQVLAPSRQASPMDYAAKRRSSR